MIAWVSSTKPGIFLCYWLLQWVTAIYGIFFRKANTVLKSEGRLNGFQNLIHWAKQDVWLSSTIASFFFSWAVISVFQLSWIHVFSRLIIIMYAIRLHSELWQRSQSTFFPANFAKCLLKGLLLPSTPPNVSEVSAKGECQLSCWK